MRYLRLALLPLVFAACSEQAPVAPIEDGPAFNFSNNPDVANPKIFRGETHWRSCWTDATNGLRVCHGTLPLGPLPGPSEPCGLQEEGDPIVFQDVGVFNPDDPFSSFIHEIVTGETFITVRDLNEPGDCFGARLVAEGWGMFMYVDNDIFGVGPEGNNANAWGFKGHGVLTSVDDGSDVVYNGQIRWRVISPQGFTNNDNIFKVANAKVNLR